jgi:TonB family protein
VSSVVDTVARHWHARTADKKLRVAVQFHVLKDGTLEHLHLVPSEVEHARAENAALKAIKSAAPFQHLPDGWTTDPIALRVYFDASSYPKGVHAVIVISEQPDPAE